MPTPSLGVIFHRIFPPETLVDYAHRAEAAGFDELWLWEDCFYAGGLTSAAVALAATERLKVGVGILPATVRNPVFAAMELMTLARLYPGRLLPGFGHGVDSWMKQIGASPLSTMKALEETVSAVRALLCGENVNTQGDYVRLENAQMKFTPQQPLPLYVGAMREKTLRLAGRVGDGAILTQMSSPAYIRWAREHIAAGMAEAGQTEHRIVVFVQSKVTPNDTTRTETRRALAARFGKSSPLLQPLGIADEAESLYRQYGADGAAQRMPETWVDELSASGTPEQAVASLKHFAEAGADSIVLQPLEGDTACLDEYHHYLLPLVKT